MRIVSCVPSLSELVWWLDSSALVGRTRFCIHPESIRSVTRVGGTRNLNPDRIQALNPDLILGAREENDRDQMTRLSAGYPCRIFDIRSVADCRNAISELALLLRQPEKLRVWETAFEERWSRFRPGYRGTCLYLIWQEPWMAAGGDTFIHDVLTRAGFVNVLGNARRYPTVSEAEMDMWEPDFIFLSDEPFPFNESHKAVLQQRFPKSRIECVDGAWFSWYSQRVAQLPDYLESLWNGNQGPGNESRKSGRWSPV